MFAPFQKMFKDSVDIEVRRGVTGGQYAVCNIKLGSLRKKDLPGILAMMNEFAERIPQTPVKTNEVVPNGDRQFPVEARYVSA